MSKYKEMGYFQTFPFGVDMTDVELILAKTLKTLKGRMSAPKGVIGSIKQAISTHTIPEAATPYLERMQLLDPQTLADKMLRKLIVGVLTSEGDI